MPNVTWRRWFVRISKHQYINPLAIVWWFTVDNPRECYKADPSWLSSFGTFPNLPVGQDTRVQWSISSQVQLWIRHHVWKADVAYLNEDHQESCMFRRRASGLARPPLEGRWLQRVEASWFVCPPKCFDLLLLKKPVERHATGFRSTELR